MRLVRFVLSCCNIRAEQACWSPARCPRLWLPPPPPFFCLLFSLWGPLPLATFLETGWEGRPVSLGGMVGGWLSLGGAPHALGRFLGCLGRHHTVVPCDVNGSTVAVEGFQSCERAGLWGTC